MSVNEHDRAVVTMETSRPNPARLYAAGHLPTAKSLMPLTPVVLTAVLLPTGPAALAFGYLTWKRDIEAAMLAHFSSDIVAHVLGPMILR